MNEVLTDVEGQVKWFDPRKGFGFIVGPAGQDIFVHYSVIQGDGFRVLKDGSTVIYSAESTGKGWRATKAARAADLQVPGSTPQSTATPAPGQPKAQ